MNKNKRIKELEEQLSIEKERREKAEVCARRLNEKMNLLQKKLNAIPATCKTGEYCRYCAHSKYFCYETVYGVDRDVYVCCFAECCSNFTPRKNMEVKND
jgi:hypothetical protein